MLGKKRNKSEEKKLLSKGEKSLSTYNIEPKSNSSSGSDSLGFQTNKDENNVTIKYERIKSVFDLEDKLNLIEEPCILENVSFLKIEKDEKKLYEFPLKIFNDIKKENIRLLNNSKIKREFFDSKLENKIIFSSKIFPAINTENDANLEIFNKIHCYKTNFNEESKISDFCFNKGLYFPDCFNDIYYKIDRFFTKNFRAHHMNNGQKSKIDYHFGLSGGGKSICSRAIIHNYMHFEKVSGREAFFPTIFFDLKVINSLMNDKYSLLNILKCETMGLFREYKDWKTYQEKIKEYVNEKNCPFEIFFAIVKDISSNENIKKVLIVIDHYSENYDNKNINLEEIKKFCFDIKNHKFYFIIIYDIINLKDQECFFGWFKKNINFPEISRIHDIDSFEASIYHKYELKNLNESRAQLKNIPDIPDNYETIFGQNICYYFKYMNYILINPSKNFQDFVNEENNIMKLYLRNYYKSFDNDSYYEIIVKIKEYLNNLNEESEMSFNNDIYKYFPASYFLYGKNESNNAYSLKPAFPLIKSSLSELYEKLVDNKLINLKDKRFLKLDPQPMGTFFDVFMNIWFQEKLNTKLFQFEANDFEVIKIDNFIKKNQPKRKVEDFYYKKDVYKEINNNKELKEKKIKYEKIPINKKCMVIFQQFGAKAIDIFFLVKNEENDFYLMNCFQMKCSDEYVIDEKLFIKNQYEMTYAKNKIEILFNIKIKESYVTYISIQEKPKECAKKNRNKFFYYSIDLDMMVDQDKNEIKKIPFYKDCFINFIEEDEALQNARYFIQDNFFTLKFNINEINVQNEKNLIKNNMIIVKNSNKKNSVNIYIKNKHYKIKEYCEKKDSKKNKKFYQIDILEE